MHHTQPRYTADLGLLVERTPENIRRLRAALTDFAGAPMAEAATRLYDERGVARGVIARGVRT